jgi:putative transposase
MPNYRRWYQPGGTYFFTVVAYRRRNLFKAQRARDLLGDALRKVAAIAPFQTIATVLLWDHLHVIWSLPAGDADYSNRWRAIKREFSVSYLADGGRDIEVTAAEASIGRRGIWQPRFWEHLVRDEEELSALCDYIHYNPVKHGYVARPWDWVPSTFRRFVSAGEYERHWGSRSEPLHLLGLDYE